MRKFLKLVSYPIAGIATLLAMPLIILGEIVRIIGFIIFLGWREYRANKIMFKFGWEGRRKFLKNNPSTYMKFSQAVTDG